jgi:hypothetical protein
MSFHVEGGWGKRTPSQNRLEKEHRVMEGRVHAALVYDGPAPAGWCQFGPTAEASAHREQAGLSHRSSGLEDHLLLVMAKIVRNPLQEVEASRVFAPSGFW